MKSKLSGSLRLVRSLLVGRWRMLVGAGLLALVISTCRGGLVLLVKALVERLETGSGPSGVLPVALAVVGLFAVQGLARVGRLLATRTAAYRAEAELRARVFGHLLGRSPADLQEDGVGESLATLMHDVSAVRSAVGAAVTIVQRPLTALAVGGAAVWMSPRLAVAGIVLGPVVAAVVAWSGRRTRGAANTHLAHLGQVQAAAQDDLSGLRTLQSYGAEDAALARHVDADSAQVEAAVRRTLFQAIGPPLVELAAAVALAGVVVVGAADVAAGSLSSGELIAFLVAVALLHEPLKGIAVAHGLWEESRAGLDRVEAVLARPVGVSDRDGAIAWSGRPHRVELAGVSVERGRGTVLENVGISLRRGQIVVIQGASGSGKSTLLDVLARFVAPSSGSVRWDGQDIEGFSVRSIRAAMARVDQSPWLGRGSIADAVRLGSPDASDADVQEALSAAGLGAGEGILAGIEGGVNARIGDGGGGISGGERRRIALARALVRNAPVLLLDEPTSDLDPATERRFLDTLRTVGRDRILLIVAHGTACADVGDVVYELRDGGLVLVRGSVAVA